MNTVEEFLKSKDYKDSTRNEYTKAFSRLSRLFGTDDFIKLFTESYEDVVNRLQRDFSSNTYWNKINVFCKHYSIDYREPPNSEKKDVEKFNIIKIRADIRKIIDIKARVFLMLFTNESQVAVRRDWCNVMIKKNCTKEQLESAKAVYDKGVFEFIELNKTGRRLKFNTNKELEDTIEEYISTIGKSTYFYTYTSKTQENEADRVASYAKFVHRITSKYLGRPLSMNNFRQMMTQGDRDAILNSDSSTMEKLSKLVSAAKLKDHTVEVELQYYTETKDSKVCNASTQTESRIDTIEILKRLHSIKEYVSELERRVLQG